MKPSIHVQMCDPLNKTLVTVQCEIQNLSIFAVLNGGADISFSITFIDINTIIDSITIKSSGTITYETTLSIGTVAI